MPGTPKPIGNILAELLAKRGYARVQSAGLSADAWRQAAGEQLAALSRPGNLRGGKLEVLVKSSVLVQELGFRKQELLTRLNQLLPNENIRDLKFRVAPLD